MRAHSRKSFNENGSTFPQSKSDLSGTPEMCSKPNHLSFQIAVPDISHCCMFFQSFFPSSNFHILGLAQLSGYKYYQTIILLSIQYASSYRRNGVRGYLDRSILCLSLWYRKFVEETGCAECYRILFLKSVSFYSFLST